MTGANSGHTDEVDRIIEEWQSERPDADVETIGTIGRVARLAAIQGILLREVDEAHGLNAAAFDVMASLKRSGPPYRKTAGELATSSLLTSGGVTLRLDRLEADGWVRRIRSEEDRRVVYAELTEKGLAKIDAVFDAHIAVERQLVAGLPPAERKKLNDLLRKLLASYNTAFAGEEADDSGVASTGR